MTPEEKKFELECAESLRKCIYRNEERRRSRHEASEEYRVEKYRDWVNAKKLERDIEIESLFKIIEHRELSGECYCKEAMRNYALKAEDAYLTRDQTVDEIETLMRKKYCCYNCYEKAGGDIYAETQRFLKQHTEESIHQI